MSAGFSYRFGEFELDPEAGQLRCKGAGVHIDPKPLAMIAYLIQHRDRAVSKQELLREIWSGVVVSDSALTSALRDARRALGDDGSAQRLLRTERGRGLRFTAPWVVAAARAPTQSSGPLGEDPFVGREAFLAELLSHQGRAQNGSGGLLLLPGAPGIGKSRILRELSARARAAGTVVAQAWCERDEAAPPFRPWSQLLRRLVDGRDVAGLRGTLGAGAADVARLVPLLANEEDGAAEPALPAEELRYRLFDAVSACFGALTAERAAVLLIDDLQWADAASLRLLEFLANDLGRQRVLVVAAYRDVAADARAGTERAIDAIAARSGVERLPIPPLDAEAARTLVGSLAGPTGAETVERIASRAGGIPFLLRELASAVRRGADLGSIPDSVRRVVALNLKALPSEALPVLELAAVRGEAFEPELLAKLAEGDATAEALEAARARGLVVRESSERWRFAHALIQECVLERMDAARCAALHARVGEALEAASAAAPEPLLDALAHHFHAGRASAGARRAIDWGLRAAEAASRALAPERAAEHYRRVLETLEEDAAGDPRRRAETLLALATVQSPNAEAIERAAALAREIGDPALLARAALAYVPPTHPSFDPLWVPLCEEALAVTPESALATRASLLGRLAQGLEFRHDAERGSALSLEAVTLARRAGDEGALIEALSTRIQFNMRQDQIEQGLLEDAEELFAIAERTRRWTMGCFAVGGCYSALGDRVRGDRTFERMEVWARRWRSPHVRWGLAIWRSIRAGDVGRMEEQQRAAAEAEALGRRFGIPQVEQFSQALAFHRAAVSGGRAERLAIVEALSAPGALPWMLCWRARLLAEEGVLAEARPLYERLVRDDLAAIPRNATWDASVFDLAVACVELDDRPRARSLADELRPFADRGYFRPGAFVGPGGQALGRLLALLGKPREAEEAYRRALAWCARLGSRLGELDTRVDLACLPPSPDRAALQAVIAEARALGLRAVVDRAARACE